MHVEIEGALGVVIPRAISLRRTISLLGYLFVVRISAGVYLAGGITAGSH